jgi:predicted MPP superfamily phosphohydrolase
MKRFRYFSAAALMAVLGLGVWAFAIEPASLTVRKYELSVPDWNAQLGGLRVAVLADLHVGSPFNGISKLDRIVELTNSLKPDLIVLPGDLRAGLSSTARSSDRPIGVRAALRVWSRSGKWPQHVRQSRFGNQHIAGALQGAARGDFAGVESE